MKKIFTISGIVLLITCLSRCHKADLLPAERYDDRLSAGLATNFDASSHAFTHAIDGLSARDQRVHDLGDQTFESKFVAAPAPVFGGLGPIFNNVSCINCHRNDGGGLPTTGSATSGLLMRISQAGTDAYGGALAVSGYGTQVQDLAILGAKPEAHVNISYTEVPFTYPDGVVTSLRHPVYELQNLYTPISVPYMISPRLAPRLVGLGLLEKVPENTILAFVDDGDKNDDGITGKANYVYDAYANQIVIGRFGLKANAPSLLMQIAMAYQQDMGVTSYPTSQESAFGQSQYQSVTDIGSTELADSMLNYVTFYVKTLAVPARRNVTDPDVKAGSILFNQVNCTACHRATIYTGTESSTPQLSGQQIHPYTDLLLHDMGDGLADDRPDFRANGKEWRTQPLWGLGLMQKTTGTAYYLHDGRARTIEEAILWHDGEAKKSRDAFTQLTNQQRDQLMKFLNSL
ncbi:MAG: di-heme oxidoredictase family protein [Bacteroidota bacterium]|nr:di-heme oxidoredictase family protein [Bacteroidota bacterium]MDP4213617.1 di-heme oxidoredictase family protein [Bacteroidota bacterium]MDP4248479.1 di-heme oxidoredictase family protein [Bacteroidota bacterium]